MKQVKLTIMALSLFLLLCGCGLFGDASLLFRRLKSMSTGSGTFEIFSGSGGDDGEDAKQVSISSEIDRLNKDGFYLSGDLSMISEVATCGAYKLPTWKSILFRRDGFVLRFDRYSYYISIMIDRDCKITAATGYVSDMSWF